MSAVEGGGSVEGAGGGAVAADVESLRRELREARAALDAAELKRRIDRALWDAQTVDLEAASLLAEAALRGSPGRDVASAVSELRRTRPHLFRQRASASAMSESAGPSSAGLEEAALAARSTGDRGALLRYLRLRRGR